MESQPILSKARDPSDILTPEERQFMGNDCKKNVFFGFLPALVGVGLSCMWVAARSYACDGSNNCLPTAGAYIGLITSIVGISATVFSCVGSCIWGERTIRYAQQNSTVSVNCMKPCPKWSFVSCLGIASLTIGLAGTIITIMNLSKCHGPLGKNPIGDPICPFWEN